MYRRQLGCCIFRVYYFLLNLPSGFSIYLLLRNGLILTRFFQFFVLPVLKFVRTSRCLFTILFISILKWIWIQRIEIVALSIVLLLTLTGVTSDVSLNLRGKILHRHWGYHFNTSNNVCLQFLLLKKWNLRYRFKSLAHTFFLANSTDSSNNRYNQCQIESKQKCAQCPYLQPIY